MRRDVVVCSCKMCVCTCIHSVREIVVKKEAYSIFRRPPSSKASLLPSPLTCFKAMALVCRDRSSAVLPALLEQPNGSI